MVLQAAQLLHATFREMMETEVNVSSFQIFSISKKGGFFCKVTKLQEYGLFCSEDRIKQ